MNINGVMRCTIGALFVMVMDGNAQMVKSPAQAAPATVVERSVTLSLRDVTIKQAIGEIAQQSGTAVRLSNEVLTSNVRVSVSVARASTREAVHAVLRGTGFELQRSALGGLMIVRQT